MPPPDTRAEMIAKGLSEAQRRTLLAMPERAHIDASTPNPFGALLLHRAQPGLLTGFGKDEDPSGKYYTLTPLGLEVRKFLASQEADRGR